MFDSCATSAKNSFGTLMTRALSVSRNIHLLGVPGGMMSMSPCTASPRCTCPPRSHVMSDEGPIWIRICGSAGAGALINPGGSVCNRAVRVGEGTVRLSLFPRRTIKTVAASRRRHNAGSNATHRAVSTCPAIALEWAALNPPLRGLQGQAVGQLRDLRFAPL